VRCGEESLREIGEDGASEEEGDGQGVQFERDFALEILANLRWKGNGRDQSELSHCHEGRGVLAAESLTEKFRGWCRWKGGGGLWVAPAAPACSRGTRHWRYIQTARGKWPTRRAAASRGVEMGGEWAGEGHRTQRGEVVAGGGGGSGF
jgi:hypothetical protein